jgi:hypothetical protein
LKTEGSLRVFHRHFGRGTLQSLMFRGRRAVVYFDRGPTLAVWVSELTTVMDEGPLGRGVKLRSDLNLPLLGGAGGDRKIVESFRLGIVPESAVQEWTFGRDGELSYLSEWLADPDESVFYLFGDYGSGKTHFLNAAALHAEREGWVVALVPLDPLDSPPSAPRRVYNRLMQNLRWRGPDGSACDARDLIQRCIDGGLDASATDHPYLTEFLERLNRCRNPERLWAWLMGEEEGILTDLPTMHDHTTASNLYCNLLSFFGYAAKTWCGAKGLLLLLDEAEMVTAVRWHQQIQRGLDFITGLSLAANLDPRLSEEPVVKEEGLHIYRGLNTGLVYSGHLKALPYLHPLARDQRTLKVIFAVTPTDLMRDLVERHDFDAMDLEPLPRAALETLFDRFTRHYREVLGVPVGRREMDRIKRALFGDLAVHGTQRRFIKGMVEAMDYLRFHRERGLDALLGLDLNPDTTFGERW